MKTPSHSSDTNLRCLRAAFTLTETVIAIGVLAVVLTGFIAVFTPAAQGIRRAISSEQADRLTSTLERELVTVRSGQTPTKDPFDTTTPPKPILGFTKGFIWLAEGRDATKAIFVYQYRANLTGKKPDGTNEVPRPDGTATPYASIKGQPGKEFIVQSMARRADDSLLIDDLTALEGPLFFVKPTQLVYSGNTLSLDVTPTNGKLKNPAGATLPDTDDVSKYQEAVIAFSAEFHSVPSKTFAYLNSEDGFGKRFSDIVKEDSTVKPIFTRNLAVRR
jgi:type II secretory pathway pseudopilin PulG